MAGRNSPDYGRPGRALRSGNFIQSIEKGFINRNAGGPSPTYFYSILHDVALLTDAC
jgi:hypothetical protein